MAQKHQILARKCSNCNKTFRVTSNEMKLHFDACLKSSN